MRQASEFISGYALPRAILRWLLLLLCLFGLSLPATPAHALSSSNIPLDSIIYRYLEKLAGFGLITSDVQGLKPYSRAEAARLLLEAEERLQSLEAEPPRLAVEMVNRLRALLPREISLYHDGTKAPLFDMNPLAYARARYVYLDGVPRSYERDVYDPAGQEAFGFIGGNLRRQPPSIVHTTGTEGTPLLENNEGVIYRRGNNGELLLAMEGYLKTWATALVAPALLHTPDHDQLFLEQGYLKLGGGGLELEVGRDANWFGPGYRGTTTLTNNAKNFDLIKLSSPEPVDVGWVKKYLGDFKYSLILSRFDETGSGESLRQPYFFGMKLALKPKPWCEIGFNLVRQEGGPGLPGDPSFFDTLFGGQPNDGVNSIAGFDLRFRIPALRNLEIYGEYSGEDSAGFWPFVESYVAGVYIPNLTATGQDDFRFEFFYGSVILYSDYQFPEGYVYHTMTPGHSQGTAVLDFFFRYSHWFSARNNLALEYITTQRGREGRVTVNSAGHYDPNGTLQGIERKNAVRATWTLPVYGEWDLNLGFGWEHISNWNLMQDQNRTNQVVQVDLKFRY